MSYPVPFNVHYESYGYNKPKKKEPRRIIKLREQIRAASKIIKEYNEMRDRDMLRLRREGLTFKAIGIIHHLTIERARQIIYKQIRIENHRTVFKALHRLQRACEIIKTIKVEEL